MTRWLANAAAWLLDRIDRHVCRFAEVTHDEEGL